MEPRLPARVLLWLSAVLWLPGTSTSQVAPLRTTQAKFNYNLNEQSTASRPPTSSQQKAITAFKAKYPQAVLRWDGFAGSVDTLWGFKSRAYSGDPAGAALQFISENGTLFGVSDTSTLKPKRVQSTSDGHLVRCDETYYGLRVRGGGIGVVLNASKQVIGAFGPYYSIGGVSTSQKISSADAVTRARQNLNAFAVAVPPDAQDKITPALQLIEKELGPLNEPAPELTIFPTAGGYRLAWGFFLYSRNPFGVFRYCVDANTGEVLTRQNMVRAMQASSNLLGATGDIFPTHPGIDKGLQESGLIPRDPFTGAPLGQLRVNLRNFDATNATSGTAGELTGTHAHVHNALAVKAPFLQPPLSTWHFAKDVPPLEQATREAFHFGA